MAADGEPQCLFFQVGLFHQPVRQPAQQIQMRTAAFEAASPEPDVIGKQQRDAALAFMRQDQERFGIRPLHHGCSG